MASFMHEMDRNEGEQGTRVALDLVLENFGYKEERIATVTRRAAYADKLTELSER